MAFIFSDLVVLPVLRVNAKFYGWKMAIYILGIFLMAIVASALVMHYGFAAFGLLPDAVSGEGNGQPKPEFSMNYTFWMNLVFVGLTVALGVLRFQGKQHEDGEGQKSSETTWVEKVLMGIVWLAILWLGGGVLAGIGA